MTEQVGTEADVRLVEITAETVRAVCKLSDTLPENQQRMVADNAVSIPPLETREVWVDVQVGEK